MSPDGSAISYPPQACITRPRRDRFFLPLAQIYSLKTSPQKAYDGDCGNHEALCGNSFHSTVLFLPLGLRSSGREIGSCSMQHAACRNKIGFDRDRIVCTCIVIFPGCCPNIMYDCTCLASSFLVPNSEPYLLWKQNSVELSLLCRPQTFSIQQSDI